MLLCKGVEQKYVAKIKGRKPVLEENFEYRITY